MINKIRQGVQMIKKNSQNAYKGKPQIKERRTPYR